MSSSQLTNSYFSEGYVYHQPENDAEMNQWVSLQKPPDEIDEIPGQIADLKGISTAQKGSFNPAVQMAWR